jgi:hypothetical protein
LSTTTKLFQDFIKEPSIALAKSKENYFGWDDGKTWHGTSSFSLTSSQLINLILFYVSEFFLFTSFAVIRVNKMLMMMKIKCNEFKSSQVSGEVFIANRRNVELEEIIYVARKKKRWRWKGVWRGRKGMKGVFGDKLENICHFKAFEYL